jgi:hypothetical protein
MYQLGRYQEAADWIGMAVQSAEEASGTVLEHYGDVLFKLGQTDRRLCTGSRQRRRATLLSCSQRKSKTEKLYEIEH